MDAVQYLVRGFRARLPVRQLLDGCEQLYGDVGWSEREAQDRVTEAVQSSGRHDSYSAKFLRLYLREVDLSPSGRECMSESLIETAAASCQSANTEHDLEGVCEATYEFSFEGQPQEATVFISPAMSDVYLRVWDAGIFLFDCILSNVLDVRDRSVAELGAGSGLLVSSLSLAKATNVLLTDRSIAVDNLNRTIRRNNLADFATAAALDVEEASEEDIAKALSEIDVLLGAGEIAVHPKRRQRA